MPCQKLPLGQELPSKPGYSTEQECKDNCCSGMCCYYQENIGVEAQTQDSGWKSKYNGSSTQFFKPTDCENSEPELQFTWSEVGNPSNQQTYPSYFSTGAVCCGTECCAPWEDCCNGTCCDRYTSICIDDNAGGEPQCLPA